MIPYNLLYAEWLKMRTNPLNIGIAVFLFAAMTLYSGSLIVLALSLPDQYLSGAQHLLTFANGLEMLNNLLGGIGPLLMVIFIANSVGSEYGRDTWKMILPRYGNRTAFLQAKLLVALALAGATVLALILSCLGFGWIGATLLQIEWFDAAALPDLWLQLKALVLFLLNMVLYAAVTFFFTIWRRSTLIGILAGMSIIELLALLSFLSDGVKLLLPTLHLQNIGSQWISGESGVGVFGDITVAPVVSSLVILLYVLLCLGAAGFLFMQRDVTSSSH